MLASTSLSLRTLVRPSRVSLCHAPSSASFHVSSAVAATPKGRARSPILKNRRSPKGFSNTQYKPTSRTRLVKSLRAGKGEGVYEVAKRRNFNENGRQESTEPLWKKKINSSTIGNVLKRPEPHVVAARKDANVQALLDEEFDRSTTQTQTTENLPTSFAYPGLLPAFTQSMTDILGSSAKPTPIQALALKHLVPLSHSSESWRQALLASETGSGKSFAYLLPLLQHLKETEHIAAASASDPSSSLAVTPRALVLAPTHELSRQLAAFAKGLIHHAKLRVLCASRANVLNRSGVRAGGGTARQMKRVADALVQNEMDKNSSSSASGHFDLDQRLVDVLVSTPVKALEMVRGWGWDKSKEGVDKDGKAFTPGKSEMGLERVECVVVDEADILFDPDFKSETLNLLADISAARGHPLPPTNTDTPPAPTPSTQYPFHLLLTSATIPASLSAHLTTHHPSCTRLASPNLHRLPPTLHTEHHPFAGGTGARGAAIATRLRRVWAEDALRGPDPATGRIRRSRVLIFANKRGAAAALAADLEARGIPCVALAGGSAARAMGSNKHLSGFLKPTPGLTPKDDKDKERDLEKAPRVLITTSLLSRGLDFAPDVRHVFLVDSPRNMVDFLHRAGRSARAGMPGTVVIFGKARGRGAGTIKAVRDKVHALQSKSVRR